MLLETVFIRTERDQLGVVSLDLIRSGNESLFAQLWNFMLPGEAYSLDEARDRIRHLPHGSGILTAQAMLKLVQLGAATFRTRLASVTRDAGMTFPDSGIDPVRQPYFELASRVPNADAAAQQEGGAQVLSLLEQGGHTFDELRLRLHAQRSGTDDQDAARVQLEQTLNRLIVARSVRVSSQRRRPSTDQPSPQL